MPFHSLCFPSNPTRQPGLSLRWSFQNATSRGRFSLDVSALRMYLRPGSILSLEVSSPWKYPRPGPLLWSKKSETCEKLRLETQYERNKDEDIVGVTSLLAACAERIHQMIKTREGVSRQLGKTFTPLSVPDVLGLSPRSAKFLSKSPFCPCFLAVSACETDDSSSALDERKGDWDGRQTLSESSECPAPAGVFSWRTFPSIGRFNAADGGRLAS